MITFWVIAAAMAVGALAFIVPPLLRSHEAGGPDHAALNVTLHRQRLKELDVDLGNGVLSKEQYAAAREDVERDLLYDLESGTNGGKVSTQVKPWTAVVASLFVPALAFGLYLNFGAWELIDNPAATSAPEHAAANGEQDKPLPSVDEMATILEQRLAETPEDMTGWTMLGRSYSYMQRYPDAARAFQRAYDLSNGQDAALTLDYAEALALSNDSRLQGKPTELVEEALALEADNSKGLWLAGMSGFQEERFTDAISYWNRLNALTPAGSEEAELLAGYLAEARNRAGIDPSAAPAVAAGKPETAPAQDESGIKVSVSLATDVASQANPGDTVFIFARAAEGPRMPLAIVRKTVADLPVTVYLNDTMAMTPAMRISMFPKIVVGARVSKSGNAIPASGDLQGISSSIGTGDLDSQKVSIEISELIP